MLTFLFTVQFMEMGSNAQGFEKFSYMTIRIVMDGLQLSNAAEKSDHHPGLRAFEVHRLFMSASQVLRGSKYPSYCLRSGCKSMIIALQRHSA